MSRDEALIEVVLNALCDSDDGNNPFYRDDQDTVSLAEQVAEAVVAHNYVLLRRKPLAAPLPKEMP